MSHILAKNFDFEGAPTMGGFQYDPPLQLRAIRDFQFYFFTEAFKVIPRTVTSDESHFSQKRRFRGSADCGLISARFAPSAITRNFRFSNFTAYGAFKSNSVNHHFRRVAF